MRTISGLLLAGLLLGGCTPGAVIANRDQVVVEARSVKAAVTLAERRCAEYGLRAHFENEGWSTYAFSCRERTDEQAASGQAERPFSIDDHGMEKTSAEMSDTAPQPESSHAEQNKDHAEMAAVKSAPAMSAPVSIGAPLQLQPGMKTATKPMAEASEIKRASKGTIWVQIASSSKDAEARAAARQLIASHADVIGTSSFMIQKARVRSAGTVYRTRVGPYKRFAAANNACQKLKSRRLECLVVIR
tara:strand:- start:213 stop:950 length:738 start_codon:yes stop_codon:yes gene_type:complete